MSDKAETEIQVWGPGLGLPQEFLLPDVQATLNSLSTLFTDPEHLGEWKAAHSPAAQLMKIRETSMSLCLSPQRRELQEPAGHPKVQAPPFQALMR